MSTVHGTVAHGFEAVREGFAEGQLSDEGGAQLCVYHNGRKVVDLWGGRDKVRDRPYTDKTIAILMSCTKGMLATCAHMLAERGQLDLDAPVTKYWPEFGQNGKAQVPVSYLLSHRVGLTSFEPASGIGPKELLDWKTCTDALAAMAPLWEPGTSTMYHAVTYGYLVGEVIRRVTGQMPGRFFAENVARPLSLRLWIGLPASEEDNVAPHFSSRPAMTLEQWTGLLGGFGIDTNSRVAQVMMHMLIGTDEAMQMINTREGHAAEIPAANGIGDAASLAKMYAATIGEIDGVRLLKKETVERGAQVPDRRPQGAGRFRQAAERRSAAPRPRL